MDQKTEIKGDNHKKTFVSPYARYQGTKEWMIIENSLKDLESNQDIKITTVPEYVVGYIVKKLRDENLLLFEEKKSKGKN